MRHGATIFIARFVLLLLVGRGLGEVRQRVGQPAMLERLIICPSLFAWRRTDGRQPTRADAAGAAYWSNMTRVYPPCCHGL
jgi:hypothetical protein